MNNNCLSLFYATHDSWMRDNCECVEKTTGDIFLHYCVCDEGVRVPFGVRVRVEKVIFMSVHVCTCM